VTRYSSQKNPILFGRKEVDTMVDKPLASKIAEVEEEIQQARKKLEDLEKRLHAAFEKFLKRLEQEK
jgi:molecular chaperone GrpE (heat shock protein)